MKNSQRMSGLSLATGFVAMLFMGTAQADLQYRVGYEAATNEYVVYMTPDSVPSPDFALSGQVTLKVPHTTPNTDFNIQNIQSAVSGISWQPHSIIQGPSESPDVDYVSFGLVLSGGTVVDFSWVPGVEKKVFSFQAASGCRDGVSLLDNADAFSQLPNSAGTNPGNHFTNLGWASANNYMGNYGRSVVCPGEPIDPRVCAKAKRQISRIDWRIERAKEQLRRLEERKQKSQLSLDVLETRKDTLAEFCPA